MKYLMLDMDGTICEFHDPIDGKIHMTEFPDGFFENKRPLNCIINVVKEKYKDYTKIIFSVSPTEQADKEKSIWLHRYGFDDYLKIFLRYPNTDKGQALSIFIQKNNINPEDITLIDDDLRVLRSCEKLNVHCIHPSHLVAEYESKAQHN